MLEKRRFRNPSTLLMTVLIVEQEKISISATTKASELLFQSSVKLWLMSSMNQLETQDVLKVSSAMMALPKVIGE